MIPTVSEMVNVTVPQAEYVNLVQMETVTHPAMVLGVDVEKMMIASATTYVV